MTAATHKLRWFDVTNADHSRVTIRFIDGVEAEFVHSDLAAALKPRWYVLGTLGAVVGHWRTEKVVSRNDIGTLAEDVLAPADSPPLLDLHAADGSVTRLAAPAPDAVRVPPRGGRPDPHRPAHDGHRGAVATGAGRDGGRARFRDERAAGPVTPR